MAAIWGLIGVLVVLVVGYGTYTWWMNQPSPLNEGVVQSRHFTPAHWEDYLRAEIRTRPGIRTSCSGSPVVCRTETYIETYTVYVPDTQWVSDRWDITVHGCSYDRSNDEHCRDDSIAVSESIYDQCNDGRYWRRDEGCTSR